MITALLTVWASTTYSHDIWLVPDRSVLSGGDVLRVRQLAGSELEVEMELELLRRMTRRFELVTAQGSVDLLAALPDMRTRPVVKPVLEREVDFEGQALLTMEHAFIYNEFTREEFVEYLEHEELDLKAFEEFMGRGPSERERYARTLKCLVQAGDADDGDLHKRVLGQKLELLLLQNPYQLDPGDRLDVQVLFESKPLQDALVTAFVRDGDNAIAASKSRTEEGGVAKFELDRKGRWLVRLVHLMPCPGDPEGDCLGAEWESYWTSFSFELP